MLILPQAATFEQEDSTSLSNPTYDLCKKPLRSFQTITIPDDELQLRASSMGRTPDEKAKRAHQARTRMANRHSRDRSSQQTLFEKLRIASNLEVLKLVLGFTYPGFNTRHGPGSTLIFLVASRCERQHDTMNFNDCTNKG
jgi:hypothetical protein